jgi:HTH-type transcriptional regulator/antitoxin HipB
MRLCKNYRTQIMKNLCELGEALARYRQSLGLKQGDVAKKAGIPQESLSRFERGRVVEFGSRKLLAILDSLGLEMDFSPVKSNLIATNKDDNKKTIVSEIKQQSAQLEEGMAR